MRHVLTRQQLYEMIWSRAVSKVAPEFGISDVALRKQCIKHAIPLPDTRYWGQLHAGKEPKRKPLPPLPANISGTVVIVPRAGGAAPDAVRSAIEKARAQTPVQNIPPVKSALVAKTIAAARAKKPDDWGALTGLGPACFNVRAHPDTLERVETFLTLLVNGAKARGYRFAEGREGLAMVVDGEAIGFAVTQTIRRSRHETTPEERRALERWDARHGWHAPGRPTPPWWDGVPTGEMRIEIGGWSRFAGAVHRFADTRARKLEARIDDILVSFAAIAAGMKIEAAEAAERARLAAIARAERARLAHLAELEKQRVAWLEDKLAGQAGAEALRRLVTRLADGEGGTGVARHARLGTGATGRGRGAAHAGGDRGRSGGHAGLHGTGVI
ncbi:hypothetical protein PIB19_00925 [Sphingomonas sp. 7/4-4]|uniref:hypothetical protein n=1 Tax=Sphingomonas sp. 7/4-4 TaxID=3018446 RepID=UPI0022F3EA34|nr:hypothetical protein [Sphingomonas sp. 7/4-4]WBY08151.1 hypothetical protein PIB19_00925 [Sphingomonas sp. 7/4-4]